METVEFYKCLFGKRAKVKFKSQNSTSLINSHRRTITVTELGPGFDTRWQLWLNEAAVEVIIQLEEQL